MTSMDPDLFWHMHSIRVLVVAVMLISMEMKIGRLKKHKRRVKKEPFVQKSLQNRKYAAPLGVESHPQSKLTYFFFIQEQICLALQYTNSAIQ